MKFFWIRPREAPPPGLFETLAVRIRIHPALIGDPIASLSPLPKSTTNKFVVLHALLEHLRSNL